MTWRGGEGQMMLLAGGQRLHDYHVSFIARPGSELAKRAAVAGFEVDEIDFSWHMSPLAGRQVARMLRSRKADILHIHDGHGVWMGKLGARLARTPHVVATRRVDFRVSGPMKWSWGIDRVVAISECIAGVLTSRGVPAEKIRVVHSGIDSGRFDGQGDCERFRAELGLGQWAPLIANVAALTDHKGQKYLIDAMSQIRKTHKSAHLVIAGEGELRGELEAQIDKLSLGEWVHLAGFRKDVPDILAAADVAVFSSHLEGLCTSAMDAMACGKPVVATDAGGLPEVVNDGVTGLIVPARDPDALAAAISSLLDDEKMRADMGIAARKRLEEGFTAAKMVEGNLAVYDEFLGPPPEVDADKDGGEA